MKAYERKVKEVLEILEAVEFPLGKGTEFCTPLRRKRVSNILMGVADLRPSQSFCDITFFGDGKFFTPRTRDLIKFINKHYGEALADSSYDDIRRKNLDFLVEAGLVVQAANRPGAATNDSTRGYAIAPDAVDLFTHFGDDDWDDIVKKWRNKVGSLAVKLARPRKQKLVPVKLPDGVEINLSEGKHNDLQKAIVEDFLPRFLDDPELLYLGDTAKKILVHDAERLEEIGLQAFSHDTLPDVVAIDREKGWVFFIEAVHSANPIERLRHLDLEKLSSECPLGKIYVSAFLDRESFRPWIADLSWETEVWLASDPTHMIHFNGHKFLGPYDAEED